MSADRWAELQRQLKEFELLVNESDGRLIAAARNAIQMLERERDDASSLYDALSKHVFDNRIITCVYCGHEYPPGTPPSQDAVLTEHIQVCPKHPMSALRARNDELLTEQETLISERDRLKRELAAVMDAGRAGLNAMLDAARLRRLLWLNHGHLGIGVYGDDGEMSCGICRVDFKQAPVEYIGRRFEELGREKLARHREGKQS